MSRLSTRMVVAAFLAGGTLGALAGVFVHATSSQAATASDDQLVALKASFRRPTSVPFPSDNPFSEPKRALGETLFHDRRLSIDNRRSCPSCHDRSKGFADGEAQGHGVPGRPLKRHT